MTDQDEETPLTLDMINQMQDLLYEQNGNQFWHNTNSKASTCKHEGLYKAIEGKEMPHSVHIKCSNCGSVISFIGSILYNQMKDMFDNECKDWKNKHVMKTPKPMKIGSLYGIPIFVSEDIPEEEVEVHKCRVVTTHHVDDANTFHPDAYMLETTIIKCEGCGQDIKEKKRVEYKDVNTNIQTD